MNAPNLFAGFLLGILASLIAAIVIDHVRSPRFTITTDPGNVERTRNPSVGPFAFFRAMITPAPAFTLLRYRIVGFRRTPKSVRAYLTVTNPLRDSVIFQMVPARWPAWPAPMAVQFVHDPSRAAFVPIPYFDDGEAARQRTLDFAGPKDRQPLDIVLKIEGRDEIFLYNNQNYQHGMDYSAHALPYGDYHVQVTVECEGLESTQWFFLANRGPSWRNVRLEQLGG